MSGVAHLYIGANTSVDQWVLMLDVLQSQEYGGRRMGKTGSYLADWRDIIARRKEEALCLETGIRSGTDYSILGIT